MSETECLCGRTPGHFRMKTSGCGDIPRIPGRPVTRAGLSEDEFAERRAVRPLLAAHFIMWRTLEGPSLGEWFCECGLKFGLSDSAIDHQAAIVAARTADLAAQVARGRAVLDDEPPLLRQIRDDMGAGFPNELSERRGATITGWVDRLRAALSPARPDTEGAS